MRLGSSEQCDKSVDQAAEIRSELRALGWSLRRFLPTGREEGRAVSITLADGLQTATETGVSRPKLWVLDIDFVTVAATRTAVSGARDAFNRVAREERTDARQTE
jgi:hypothetical protein